MSTPSEISAATRARHVSRALLLALALATPALAAAAQPPARPAGGASAALSDADRRQLRQQLERRYEPLAILNGVLLKARQERLGVRTVEVSGDSIVVNGARVGPEVLRSWLGDADAEPVLRLLALPPAQRQELFGLKRTVSAAGAPTPQPATAASSASGAQPASPSSAGATAGGPAAPRTEGADAEDEAAGRRRAGERAAEEGEPPTPPKAPIPPLPPSAPESPESGEAPLPPTPPTPPTPLSAATVHTGSRVRLGGPVTVERNEVADDVAVFGGPVHVEGEVSHDVVAFGGSVRINGRVGGDVRSIGGGIHLGPHAEVMGDVSSAGGSVVREPGARVHGGVSEAGGAIPGIGLRGGEPRWIHHWPFVLLFPFGFSVFGRMSLIATELLLALLAMVIARRALERVDFELATQFWKSLLAGFLAQLLFLPLLVVVSAVLLISIIGCALFLLYPVVFALLIMVGLLGYAAACYRTGRWLERRFDWAPSSPWVALLAGFAAIEMWSLVGGILSGLHIWFISWMFGFFGVAVRYVAWTSGFGAALLAYARYRARRRAGDWDSGEIPRMTPGPGAPAVPAAPAPEPPPAPAAPQAPAG